jgi:general secretion pathway protein D
MRVWKNNRGVVAHLVFVVGCLTSSHLLVAAKEEVLMAPPPGLGNQPMTPPVHSGGVNDAAMEPPPGFEGQQGMPPAPPFDGMGMPPGEGFPPPGQPPGGPMRRAGGAARPEGRMRNGGPPPSRAAAPRANNARKANPQNNEEDILKVVPQTCAPAKGKFIWNFEDEKLINILRQVSDLLCKTIVVNDSIGENLKMTIIGKSPLTPKDAWDVLMASMAAKGLALIEQGKTWTVVKRNESKSFATPTYEDGKFAGNNEEIGTLFYKVQHTSQEVLKNISRALLSKDGMVESIGDQYIIVIDSNSNIRRLGGIFAQIDIEDAINKIHIIALLNADAKTVEKQLRDLFDVTSSSGPASRGARRKRPEGKASLDIDKIIADERTNSLIVVSDKESNDKLREVIALIDQPASDQGSKGKIHVKKLRFADAKKIAETLTAVVSQGKSNRFPRRRSDEATHELFEGDVKITAHENTNTLVTVASANDYRALLATINKLDERKKQVYIEAVILDVQVNDENDFGINLFGGIPGAGGLEGLGVAANPGGRKIVEGLQKTLTAGAAGSNISGLGSNSLGALAVLSNFMSGGVAGLVGPTIGDTKIPSFGAVLQAFSTNNNVDVLSTPYLIATDNQQAEMAVGEKIPVLRGTSSVGGGGVGAGLGVPFQNIANEDVKLTFKVTPHVGAEDNVRLEIEQEVNELGTELEIMGQKHYRIRTKSAKTTLVLKDQQTGVIGGLISHKATTNDYKVPFLGDIPILGWLFKNRGSKNERRSLLLILTPYVINSDSDYKKIVERKFKEREEFARLYYGGKIKNYNKYIDYDKKAGPVSSLLLQVDSEMNKVENGGPGDGSDVVLAPKESAPKVQPRGNFVVPSANSQSLPNISLDGGSGNGDETAYLDGEQGGIDELELADDFLLEDFDENADAPEALVPDMGAGLEGGVN